MVGGDYMLSSLRLSKYIAMLLIFSTCIGVASSTTTAFAMEQKTPQAEPQLKLQQSSQQQQKLQQLETTTEQLYQYMQSGNVAKSQEQLLTVIEMVKSISFKQLTSIEGIHELAGAIMEVQQVIASVSISEKEWLRSSASLRLAVNSMLHHKNGLWLNYYKVMSEQFKSMKLARTNEDRDKLKAAIVQFEENYQLIRPAAIIVRNTSTISQLDSWVSYASKLSQESQPDWDVWKGLLTQGELALNQLFGKTTHDPVFLPFIYNQHPWRIVMLIGGWILLSLLYTAWRKYKGEQDIVTLP